MPDTMLRPCGCSGSAAGARRAPGAAVLTLLVPLAPLALLALLALTATPATARDQPYAGKRILWVDSYAPGFAWTDGILRGVRGVLADTGATVRIVHMDTKSDPSPEFAHRAGLRAKAELDAFRPHVVMASDDNAQRHFVVPFLRGGATPVVFCGVNWDASAYGYPASNVTGMVEVGLLREALELMRPFARGPRVAIIAADTESEHVNLDTYRARGLARGWTPFFLRTFDEFPAAFLRAQERADMVILGGNGGIAGWDDARAREFLAAHTAVPTGSLDAYLAPYSVFTFSKVPEEQGRWMAATALRLLDGEPPAAIPLAENRQVDLIVNLRLARAAGLVLPLALLRTATLIGQDAP